MAGRMLASSKNRAIHNVDSTSFDDGFWQHRHFKGKRRTGAATGGRGWRRALRMKEKTAVTREIRNEI